MWFRMRPVELDFLEKAPRRIAVEGVVALPRDLVWQALVDAPSWPEWFPGVRSAGYLGDPPYGVGTIRVADVGGWRMEETMLAWDESRRWAYRIDGSTAPLARAQLECTELADHATGTRVTWSFAIEPGLLLRLTGPFFRGTVQRLLDRALQRLDARARASDAAAA
jgi:carbon monoxide dehydrogenase subunit G